MFELEDFGVNESSATPINKNKDLGSSSAEHSSEQSPDANAGQSVSQCLTQIDELQKQVLDLEAQTKEKENKYVYLYADFDNFKKRSIKERSDLIKFGWESVARDLLQTVDNLERALEHVPPGMDKNFISGIQMVLGELKTTLQKQGIERVESVGKDFDPNLHEAVGQEKSELPSGKIVREFAGGYTLHGRLLRPARVTISQGEG